MPKTAFGPNFVNIGQVLPEIIGWCKFVTLIGVTIEKYIFKLMRKFEEFKFCPIFLVLWKEVGLEGIKIKKCSNLLPSCLQGDC